MKVNQLIEAKLATRMSLSDTIATHIKKLILTGAPIDIGIDWSKNNSWWKMNNKHQVAFLFGPKNYDTFIRTVAEQLGIDDDELRAELGDQYTMVSHYPAQSLVRKVLRSPEVKKVKTRFKGNYAYSGNMSEKIVKQLEQLKKDIAELNGKKDKLERQLEKIR